jgi:hypothetical protein
MQVPHLYISTRLAWRILCFTPLAIGSACPVYGQTLSANVQPPAPADSAALVTATQAKPTAPANPLTTWNFSINESVQHDSSTGWSDIVTPGLSLHPNRRLSFDVNVPWYPSLAAYTPTVVNGTTTTTTLTQQHNVIGDASASAHAGAGHGDFNFNAGAAIGFPTGDQSLGVGAAETTWHFGTHSEYSIGPFTPDVEAGIGNSSAFASSLVHKSYTAVGQMANFQAGTNVDLPQKFSLDVEAYEAMPIQLQNIFGTISRRGNHARSGSKKTLQGATGSGEDNGVNIELEHSLTRRLVLSAEYDRSFIQANDIVGFSLNWVLRAPAKPETGAPASPLSHPRN